jgi:mannose-1-phosphate guanylyltransferase/mannose-1-phosphate guanylyltransferase/mannose-6-phosphate isomerase
LSAARLSLVEARHLGGRIYPDAAAFSKAPAVSIDYALMEQADNIAVVPVSMGWSDLGSWDAVYEEAPKDCSGNVISGNVVALRSSGCLIRSDGPPVAAVDLEDLLIVATATGIVVSRRGGSQGVKEALELLNKT